MRPTRLEIEGLRSFRDQQVIDLEGRDHIAIIGDTGAGKSSLLEAITWALFGRTTFTAQANQELMNDTSTATRVTMRFVVAAQTWEVTRLLRRAGDGTVGGTRATLSKLDADGAVVEQVEKVRDVNDRIEQVLGLDFDAFVRTVLLPQGQFAQLLVADSPAERAAILRQVWRTDEIEAVGDAAKQALSDLAPLQATAIERLAGEPDDPAAHLQQLREDADRATAAAESAERHAQVAAQATEALAGTERAAAAAASATNIAGLEFDNARARAAELAPVAAEITKHLEHLEQHGNELKEQLADIPADDADGFDRELIVEVRNLIDRAVEQAATAATAAATATGIRSEAEAAAVAATEAASAAEAAGEAAASDADRRVELTATAENDRTRHASAAAALSALTTAAAEVDRARQAARDAAQAAEQAATAATGAKETSAAAEEAAADAVKAHADQTRHHAAAAAAQTLSPGEDCPICHERLPDGWTQPTVPDLDSAASAAELAKSEAQQARDTATRLATQADTAATAAQTAAAAVEAAETAVVERRAELAGVLDVEPEDLPDQPTEDLLAPLSQARTAAADAIVKHDEQARGRTAAAASTATKAETAQQTATAAAEKAEHAENTARSTRQALNATLGRLPDAISAPERAADVAAPMLEDTVERWADSTRTVLDARATVLEKRAALRTRITTELEQARTEHRQATTRLRDDVTAPAATLGSQLDAHRDRLRTAIDALAPHVEGLPDVPPPAGSIPPADLPDYVDELAGAVDVVVSAGQALSERAERERQQAKSDLAEVADTLDLDEGTAPVTVAQAAQRVAASSSDRADRATAELRRFEDRIEPLNDLQATAAELDARMKIISDIAAACNPGAFPKWLTIRRSHALLVHASQLLGEMTGGRYAFADVTDDTETWQVVDNDSGLPRSPASLSGGEKFMASLSLALGMVEMMARAGGKLESLWLDEGFGALDRTNLDAAVEALATAATGGRLVAVISHVAAVAEQIDDVLAVARTATGSKVRWLTPAERAGIAADDLGDELAGAVSGLLS